MKNIMVDLETLGTRPYSAILSIGAVVFDLDKQAINSEFYCKIKLQSCFDCGLTVDPATIDWWMGQSAEAREVFAGEDRIHLVDALNDFAVEFINEKMVSIWGNGADFDNVILTSAYERIGMPLPWKFYHNRCYRTVKSMFPEVKMERVGTYHNALDDARSQALHLMRMI